MDYEKIVPLAKVQQIGRVAWDALGQCIALEVGVSKTPEQLSWGFVSLTPPAALQLLLELDECLQGIEDVAEPKQ